MDTLCWFCDKACGGCSWSRKLEPVAGWDAKESKILSWNGDNVRSYTVFSCPEFVLTEKSEPEYRAWEKNLRKRKRKNGHE